MSVSYKRLDISKILNFQNHPRFAAEWPVRLAVSQEAKKREKLEKVKFAVFNVSAIKNLSETPFWAIVCSPPGGQDRLYANSAPDFGVRACTAES